VKLQYETSRYWPKEAKYDVFCWDLEESLGINARLVSGMGPTLEAAKQNYLDRLVSARDTLDRAIELLKNEVPRRVTK
jgi:hypothetical protein